MSFAIISNSAYFCSLARYYYFFFFFFCTVQKPPESILAHFWSTLTCGRDKMHKNWFNIYKFKRFMYIIKTKIDES